MDINQALRTFIIESIDSINTRALMVSSQDEKVFRVLDFIRQQQADSLKRLLASIDIITKEEVIGFGGETTVLK